MTKSPKNDCSSSTSVAAVRLRALKKCLHELQALYMEAVSILNILLSRPPSGVILSLCERFHVLQEYFAKRYVEARGNAIAVMGHIEAIVSCS
jgi:hypothetical protein